MRAGYFGRTNEHCDNVAMPTSDFLGPDETQPSALSGLCILVVEDSWNIAAALTSLLQAWGADVIGPAATTADAERFVSTRRPDVAVVDISLRDGERADGLIDRLYEQGVRIVVTTAYDPAEVPQSKAVVILEKPIRNDLLLAKLLPLGPAGKLISSSGIGAAGVPKVRRVSPIICLAVRSRKPLRMASGDKRCSRTERLYRELPDCPSPLCR
jgi:CheY-like chemotaxis protein